VGCGRAELKQWVATERSYGHTLSKKDLLYEFLDLLEKKNTAECAQRAKQPKESKKYAESFTERLMSWTGSLFRTPHQVTTRSPLEEKVRAKVTWQSLDDAMYLTAFSEYGILGECVANPVQFRAGVENLTIACSDQVPFWVKTARSKTLYAEFETAVMKQKAVRNKRKAPQMIKDSEAENKEAGQLEDEKEAKNEATVEAAKDGKQKQKKKIILVKRPEPDAEGQAQLRKTAEAKHDKFRVTYEARQCIRSGSAKFHC
jgi:hypothetical protein